MKKYPGSSNETDSALAEKYRLAQADTLLRITKAESMEELERMLGDPSVRQLIQEHNRKMRLRK